MWSGLLFAVLAAILNSGAGLLQASATRRTAEGGALIRDRRYLVGLGVDGLGWACTVVALRHLPVFAVQAVLAGNMALTALASRMLYHNRLRVTDRLAIGACLLGLVLVASGAGTGDPVPVSHPAEVTLGIGAGVLAVTVAALRASRHDATLAVLAGLGFGGTSIAVRAIHPAAPLELLDQPPVYLVLCFWLAGLVAYTRAIALGNLPMVTAVYLVTEVIVPGLAGIVLLGDTVRAGWVAPMVLGLALAAGGVLVLSNSPAHRA